jgi:hypothetical protein
MAGMRRGWLASMLVFGAVVASSAASFAQSSADIAARRELLEQAQRAADSGNHARALELARRAAGISMTPSVRMFIAEQETALGQFAAAFGDADTCQRDAERDNAMQNRAVVIRHCRELAQASRARVGHVVVHVPTPVVAGTVVRVAGEIVNQNLWDVGAVVTPGVVPVRVEAPGFVTFERSVTVSPGSDATVDVTLTASPAQSSPSGTVATTSPRAAPQGFTLGAAGAAGIVVFGLGAIAAGVGGGLFAHSGDGYHACVPMMCTDAMASGPRSEELAGVVLFWSGVGVAAAGAVLFVASRFMGRGSEHAPSAWIDPRGVVGVIGSF